MTNKNELYFDGGTICKTKTSFKVILDEEDYNVSIPSTTVYSLVELCDEDESRIAVLLAYIEYIRLSSSTDRIRLRKIDETIMFESICKLLTKISVEDLTTILKTLKWHQISKILTAKDPHAEIDMFV